MSYKQRTVLYSTPEVLSDDIKLSNAVRQILSLQPDAASKLIGKTTSTAYRRIHEHLTAVFDRATETLTQPEPKNINTVILGLTKGLILVEYQLSRGQISEELGSKLREVLNTLLNSLNEKDSARKFERARTLLDALAVLVYKQRGG